MPGVLDGEMSDPQAGALTAHVGRQVHRARRAQRLSRKSLSELSGVSERYLAQVEAGKGNVSIALLQKIGSALGLPLTWFLEDEGLPSADALEVAACYAGADAAVQADIRARLGLSPRGATTTDTGLRVALIGLRGAGKSTLGRRLGAALDIPFVELNDVVEEQSGMTIPDLIALYGPEGYRRLEGQALEAVALRDGPLVLAVAGGIVGTPSTFDRLLSGFTTVWLKARPEDHMTRVRGQGDERPMAGNPAAMDALRSILTGRERHYARAALHLDTSGVTEDAALDSLVALLRPNASRGPAQRRTSVSL